MHAPLRWNVREAEHVFEHRDDHDAAADAKKACYDATDESRPDHRNDQPRNLRPANIFEIQTVNLSG
jgi:hypothetical protein